MTIFSDLYFPVKFLYRLLCTIAVSLLRDNQAHLWQLYRIDKPPTCSISGLLNSVSNKLNWRICLSVGINVEELKLPRIGSIFWRGFGLQSRGCLMNQPHCTPLYQMSLNNNDNIIVSRIKVTNSLRMWLFHTFAKNLVDKFVKQPRQSSSVLWNEPTGLNHLMIMNVNRCQFPHLIFLCGSEWPMNVAPLKIHWWCFHN